MYSNDYFEGLRSERAEQEREERLISEYLAAKSEHFQKCAL